LTATDSLGRSSEASTNCRPTLAGRRLGALLEDFMKSDMQSFTMFDT